MTALVLALGSSVLWGLSDYLGGVQSRRLPAPVVLACMYATSLTVLGVVAALRGVAPPGAGAVAAGLGAGLFGIVGLVAFYRGLAIGTMSVVAPIAATGVALPVLVGLATGDQPGPLASAGLVAAVAGVVLASREPDDDPGEPGSQRRSVGLALLAGVGFGMYFVLARISAHGDVGWALLLSRISATPFVVALALRALRRGGRRAGGLDLAVLIAIGLLDLGANALFNYSSTIGELSIVAVASSLYPVVTVLLAAMLLGERVRGQQRFGVVVALCGVVLIAAGA